ncbi:hypothetical protein [Oceanobacillus rekensis]|uniref:hypothetical protein n=1 Tax=Oceanobacillus rekensis TaxID=937927 RepID=UPI000B448B6B|nr:hypothetical protein [Oceanobacillus rekensis]
MKRIILISICLILFFSLKPNGNSVQSEESYATVEDIILQVSKPNVGKLVVTSSNEENDDILYLLNEIKYELIASITKQTGLDSIEIMVGSHSVGENIDVDVLVNLPKDAKIGEATIQQIVKDIIRIVSKKENVTISEENIKITTH